MTDKQLLQIIYNNGVHWDLGDFTPIPPLEPADLARLITAKLLTVALMGHEIQPH
jgi:hypothetical protein